MSFIDYNFFPILFFLGWNILTTKQLKPTIYSTSDSTTLPALSIFSLSNSTHKKINLSNSKYQKISDILEFIPEFEFLNENQKSIGIPETNTILENQINNFSMFKDNVFKYKYLTVSKKKTDFYCFALSKNDKTINKNHNVCITDSLYGKCRNLLSINKFREKRFSTKYPEYLIFNPALQTFRRSALVFSNSSINQISNYTDVEILNYVAKPNNWLSKREKRNYFINYNLVNNNWKENFKSNLFDFTYRNTVPKSILNSDVSLFLKNFKNKNTKKFISLFENAIFFKGLSYSSNDAFFWKKIKKQLSHTWFLNRITYPSFLNQPEQRNQFFPNQIKDVSVLKKDPLKYGLFSTQTTKLKKSNSNLYNCLFQNFSFLKIKTNIRKLNNINSIQKRRSKIRLLLRIPSQKIYSLNRFQIALCFSKILQLPIFFNNNYQFNLISSFLKYFENKNRLAFSIPSNREYPESYNFMFNSSQNQLEPQTQISKTQFVNNTFEKPNQKMSYIDNYKRKKNWYMKTQFFQHISWNMKHQISDCFLDLEDLLQTAFLPVKNINNFVPKSSKILSDHNKQHFYTNDNQFIKIAKENLKTMPFINKIEDNNLLISSENTKSVWPNDFSEKFQKSSLLKLHPFYPRYFLRIYGGSWYYENLIFPYSFFNTKADSDFFQEQSMPFNLLKSSKALYAPINRNRENKPMVSKTKNNRQEVKPSSWFSAITTYFQYEHISIFTRWYQNFFKHKDIITKEKLLESKRFAIIWFYARQYNLLQNFCYWPLKNKLDYNQTFLDKNKIQFDNEFEWNSMILPNNNLSNYYNNQEKTPFFAKSQTRLESNIGIYSLAHKLSSVGFRNNNSETSIYPFKYNDSYRYNFQNMSLSNQRLKYFLSLSDLSSSPSLHSSNFLWNKEDLKKNNRPILENQTKDKDASLFFAPSTNTDTSIGTQFSNFKTFLDFQNPFFSKIYAPIYQPQGLNLLSFIANSFLNTIPNSIINSQYMTFFGSFFETHTPFLEKINFSLPNQIQPITTDEYSHSLKNSKKFKPFEAVHENFDFTLKRLKLLNGLYPKLPINGIHINPYPWITQNSSDRWSDSNYLLTSLSDSSLLQSFSETKLNDSLQTNSLLQKKRIPTTDENDSHKKPFLSASLFFNQFKNMDTPIALQKKSLKHYNSQLHFTKKPSCIKKPSIFFSSFRHLPYFFTSETLSRKNVIFPEANLSLFPLVNSYNYQLKKPIKNTSISLSISPYNLFQNDILKQNEKKQVIKPWKGFLQYKFFSVKPLSTFIKKEVGYQTSLFSWVPKLNLKTNKKISKHWLENEKKSILKTNVLPIQKNTWKIFPPLFQPLTFRFIDLNLPRTWSSELSTFPLFKNNISNTKTKVSKFSNIFENKQINKKTFWSYFTTSPIVSSVENKKSKILPPMKPDILAQTKKWNLTQKNFFHFPIPFYFSDFFRFSINGNNQSAEKSTLLINNYQNNQNTAEFDKSVFPLTDFFSIDEHKQSWNNNKFEKKNDRLILNETSKFPNSNIIVYGEKPLLKNRTVHGPPLKNQKESISLPSYLKNITNQNYQNLCPNNLNELYFVFWILFNKTLFIYLSLHYLRKFISFLGTEYIRNLFKIFVTMKFIDGNILSIIKTFQDFNFQLNQQNVIDIKVGKQLKKIKRN